MPDCYYTATRPLHRRVFLLNANGAGNSGTPLCWKSPSNHVPNATRHTRTPTSGRFNHTQTCSNRETIGGIARSGFPYAHPSTPTLILMMNLPLWPRHIHFGPFDLKKIFLFKWGTGVKVWRAFHAADTKVGDSYMATVWARLEPDTKQGFVQGLQVVLKMGRCRPKLGPWEVLEGAMLQLVRQGYFKRPIKKIMYALRVTEKARCTPNVVREGDRAFAKVLEKPQVRSRGWSLCWIVHFSYPCPLWPKRLLSFVAILGGDKSQDVSSVRAAKKVRHPYAAQVLPETRLMIECYGSCISCTLLLETFRVSIFWGCLSCNNVQPWAGYVLLKTPSRYHQPHCWNECLGHHCNHPTLGKSHA